MKKIVALVLSLVMVLGLATTAFGAADTYDLYKADKDMAGKMALSLQDKQVTIDEVAAKTNTDGSGNVAYLVLGNGEYATKTTTPTIDSYAVCAKDKTDVLYYVNIADNAGAGYFSYKLKVDAWTAFGLKCGEVSNVANTIVPGADYFYCPVTKLVHVAADPVANGELNWLLDGAVVSGGAGMAVTDHTFVANDFKYDSTLKQNVPTSAICTTCLETTAAIYADGKVPATMKPYAMANAAGYFAVVSATASTPAVDTEKVESAETFDAGIAMYVGMSVMAAAGSAVVLKKKD